MVKEYETILPFATYAPWRKDTVFREVYETIKPSTFVDEYRCYELWSLVAECAKLPGALIEVGVWRGGTGALIAKKALLCGIPEPVYLCDTFHGVVKAGLYDPLYKGGEHHDTSVEIVQALLDKMQISNTKILKGIFPEETADLIECQEISFCHIDVDVYESGKDIVDWVWERLVVGGIIVFDDYGVEHCAGITRYVNDFKEFKNVHFIYNLNGHALLIKHC